MIDRWRGGRGSRSLRASCLAALVLAAPGAAQEQAPAPALAGLDARIAAIERQLAESPDHPTAWRELLELRLFRRAVSGEARGSSREEGVAYQRRAHLEWIAAQPWNGAAYIGYGATLPLDERTDYLVDALGRATSSVELLKMTLFVLTTAGENDRALRAAERFLVDNPTDPAGFEAVHGYLLQINNGGGAREVLDAWLAGVPGDGPALVARYREDLELTRGDAERAALARELAARVAPGDRALDVCAELQAASFAELARDCYQRSLAAGLTPGGTASAREALAALADEALGSELVAALEAAPERRRSQLLAEAAVAEVQRGDCASAVGILEAPAFDGDLAAHPFIAVYDACGQGGPLESRLRAIAARLGDRGLQQLLQAWPRNQPFDFLEAEALRRLAAAADDWNLLQSLDRLYAKSGLTEERLELYSIWSRTTTRPEHPFAVKQWQELLLSVGALDELEQLLLRASRPEAAGEGYGHLGALADFYVTEGRFAEAGDAIERMQAYESRTASLARYRQSDVHLARLAWAQGDLGGAERAYRSFLEADYQFSSPAFREYCYLLVASDRLPDLFTALEELYDAASRAPELRVTGGLEDWVATRLEKIGLAGPAVEYLDRAIARQPRNGDLHERVYRLAAAEGDHARALAALEALVELDPQDPEAHERLASFRIAVDESVSASEVLDRLPAGMEASSRGLRARRAAALIDAGELVEGIRILRQLDAERPDEPQIVRQLQRAYTLLGQQQEAAEDQR